MFKFTHEGKGIIYTYEKINANTARVSWFNGTEYHDFSIVMAKRYFEDGTWIKVNYTVEDFDKAIEDAEREYREAMDKAIAKVRAAKEAKLNFLAK